MKLIDRVLRTLALGAMLALAVPAAQTAPAEFSNPEADIWQGLNVGMASYTMRKFDLDETLRFTKELGLKGVCLKSFHLDLNSTTEERQAVAQKVREAGLVLTGAGTVTMKTEEETRQAFEYAKDAGMPVITCVVPPEMMPLADQLVKQYDIKLAIHNHGPEDKLYPSPLDAYRAAQNYDQRIGVCVDLGHTVRNGDDLIAVLRQVSDRLYDIHIKDVSAAEAKGKTIEMGRGVIDHAAVIQTLRDVNYQGWLNYEFEKDADAPHPGMIESVGYLRGLLAGMAAR